MVFLVNKKLICIAFLALSSVDVTSAQDSEDPDSQTTEEPEEAPTAMPILSGVTAPTDMPILSGVGTPTEDPTTAPTALEPPRGGNVDENGCISSAGYSWCPSLDECIRSFETDCPSAAPTDSPILPGSDRDENGCIPSAGYSWCDPLKECIKSWETDCPGTTTPSPTKSPIQDSTSSPTESPTEGPTAPTSDEGVSCVDPSTYNPTFTPQCINVGSGGYTCKNVRLGGTPDYRCVAPAPTSSPTEVNRPAPGSDRDENGCIPSAGYSWCDPLKECIKSWETDCPGTTTPSPTKSPTKGPTRSPTAAPVNRPAPGSDVDENGCKSSAGYSWCASLEECIRNFETDCPAPTAKPTLGGVPAPSAKPTLGGVPAPPVVAECSAYESCRESELEGNCCPTDEVRSSNCSSSYNDCGQSFNTTSFFCYHYLLFIIITSTNTIACFEFFCFFRIAECLLMAKLFRVTC